MIESAGSPSLCDLLGGEEAVGRLAAAFYARVEADPVLRPLYPRHLGCATRALGRFLIEFFGGPPRYSSPVHTPGLHAVHARFRIGRAERDAWLRNMSAAVEELGVPEPARSAVLGYFSQASASLVNQPDPGAPKPESAAEPEAIRACPMGRELADRWVALPLYEKLIDAARAGDAETAMALVSDSRLRAVLDQRADALAPVLAAMGTSGSDALLACAGERLESQPALALARFGDGSTLLHAAAGAWSATFAAKLLELGADPNAVDEAGHAPLYHAGNGSTPRKQAGAGSGGAVVRLLIAAGADPNACGGVKACTALHMAARRDHVEVAEALLEGGADLEARDSLGETPLRRAVNCRQPHVAALLLSRGADPHSRCRRGVTPEQAARGAAMAGLFQNPRPGTSA